MLDFTPIVIEAEISDDAVEFFAEICDDEVQYEAEIETAIAEVSLPLYEGETEFTPSSEMQVIPTKGTSMMNNIVINPVPDNYGLITWNGSVLTVS